MAVIEWWAIPFHTLLNYRNFLFIVDAELEAQNR